MQKPGTVDNRDLVPARIKEKIHMRRHQELVQDTNWMI